jgi:nicotinamidase-related amidase
MQYSQAASGQGYALALDKITPGSCDYFNKRNEEVVVPGITRLVNEFRARELPIIYLCYGSDYRDLRDMPVRWRAWIKEVEDRSGVRDIFWSGNPLYAIREEFAPRPEDTVIKKTTWGAFNSSTIDQTLCNMNVHTLVMAGISTNACVETTARDAADRGYGVALVDECTADYEERAHEATLRAFHFNFGRVVGTVDEVITVLGAESSAHGESGLDLPGVGLASVLRACPD